jgi:hypothetical protein
MFACGKLPGFKNGNRARFLASDDGFQPFRQNSPGNKNRGY